MRFSALIGLTVVTSLQLAACASRSPLTVKLDASADGQPGSGGVSGASGGASAGSDGGAGGNLAGTGGQSRGNRGGAGASTGGVGGATPDAAIKDTGTVDGKGDALVTSDAKTPVDGTALCQTDLPLGVVRVSGVCYDCFCVPDGSVACNLIDCPADPDAGADAPTDAPPAVDGARDLTKEAAAGEAAPVACDNLTREAECEARSDCHPVYVDNRDCACDARGCCAQFTVCAEGGQADCRGPATCKVKQPICDGPYVIGYLGSCYEGCVRASDCAP